jgi:phenylalanyl-tRNA synthetase alpha chain
MAAGSHWSELDFKAINLKAMGSSVQGGNFHPLLKVRAEFRRILMEMGFAEMPTNK